MPLTAAAATALSGGAGALGNMLGAYVGYRGQQSANQANIEIARQTNLANERLANIGNQQELRMWNMANAYNHPVEQMKRLKEAGLNPNLIYGGSSGGASGSASGVPKVHVPQYIKTEVQNELESIARQNFMTMLNQYANMKKTEVQTDNLTRELDIKAQALINKQLEAAYQRTKTEEQRSKTRVQTALEQTQIDFLKNQNLRVKNENTRLEIENAWQSEMKEKGLINAPWWIQMWPALWNTYKDTPFVMPEQKQLSPYRRPY